MRLNPVKTVSGRTVFVSVFVLFVSFTLLYMLVLETVKKEIKSSFFSKVQTETMLLTNTALITLNALDYVSFFNMVNSFVKEDPDVYEVTFYQFSRKFPLIELKNSDKLIPECGEDIFKSPCFVVSRKRVYVSGVPIYFEVKFSTEKLVRQVEKVGSVLLTIFTTVFFLISVLLSLNLLSLKKRIEFIVRNIKNWQDGLLAFERDREEDEFAEIEKSVLDMYFEIQKERKIDELILSVTSKIVSMIPRTSNVDAFVKKLASVLREELRLDYIKVVKSEGEVVPKPGQGVLKLKNNPEYKLVFEGKFPFQDEIINIFENFIDGVISAVKEREKNESLLVASITALANAIDAMSPWTKGHSDKVSKIAVTIGEILGLRGEELKTLRIGGLLHDIGKLGIPTEILNKPGKLTPEEYETIKKHPEIGYKILKPVKELSPVLPIVLYHHERCNGEGYPCGLTCEEIPFLAKIVAVADVIEAMTAERPYKPSRSLEEVFAYLKEAAGKDREFDPEIVEAAINTYHEINSIISEKK